MSNHISGTFSFQTDEDISAKDVEQFIESKIKGHLLYGTDCTNLQVDVDIVEYGYKLVIRQDLDPISPRENDNIGTMRCGHRRYNLGDEESEGDMQDDMLRLLERHCDICLEDKWDEIYRDSDGREDWVGDGRARDDLEETFNEHFIYNMLYLYDHSGITISMNQFNCPWDSGCVGFIYTPKKKAIEELGLENKVFPLERDGKTFLSIEDYVINHVFKSEVEIYDMYLRGDVWWFTLEDAAGDTIDSCGGFFGSDWKTNGLAYHTEHLADKINKIVLCDYDDNEIEELDFDEVFDKKIEPGMEGRGDWTAY